MALLVYVVEYNSAEVVIHYSLSSILLLYVNIHPKETGHKDPCHQKMLQTLKLLVFDLVSKIYVVCGIIWKHTFANFYNKPGI